MNSTLLHCLFEFRMINFDFNEYCCGCTACFNSCAFEAITMKPNKEGFIIPSVNAEKCTECGKCEKACPFLNLRTTTSQQSINDFYDKKAYLYFSKAEQRKESASGGFVYDLFANTLNKKGIICGCVWDQNINAKHIISNKVDDLERMQGSKYVQSDLGKCFSDIKTNLKQGKDVIFCGTPCQTAGLHFYLGKTDKSHLTIVCLICHGVPSPKVWNKYKSILEKKYGGKLINVNMRDKSYKGYSTSYVKYTFIRDSKEDNNNLHNLKHVGKPTYLSDPYIFLFTDNLFLRNSCYHCAYKGNNNMADIIVGDFYASHPQAGNDGCSSLIAMTEKGEKIISSLNGNLIPMDINSVASPNPMLWKSVKKHSERSNFFLDLDNLDNISLFTKYLPYKFHIKKILNNLGLFKIVQSLIK